LPALLTAAGRSSSRIALKPPPKMASASRIPRQNYWNEFVFLAIHYHQADAIFLSGIPDLKSTLPHA
jgi:hypothetical protein